MKSCTFLCSFALALAPAMVFAQVPPIESPTNFCPSGIQPDGYVDWSAMPTPPIINYGSPSAPVTAMLPVLGVPGLTVNVQIPALTRNEDQGTSPGNAYIAAGDTLTLNALTNLSSSGSPTHITLTFSKPIQGLRVVGSSVGENPYNFSVTSDGPNSSLGTYGSTFTGSVDEGGFAQVSGPMQLLAPGALITTVNLTINGTTGEHGYQLVSWSDLRIESGSAPDPSLQVPADGLMQWLRADRGDLNGTQPVYNQPVTAWSDQSGNGHDASGSLNRSPLLAYDGQHCQRTLSFNGTQFLSFNLPIAGWTQMTVFLIAKSDNDPGGGQYGSEMSAIFWNEDAYWGNTYVSPFQTHADFRFGTTQVGNDPNYTRPATVGGDFSLTTAVHNNTTDSLYVNGLKVFTRGGKLSALGGSDGTGFLGRGYNNTYYHGKISEVLVYNRILTDGETQIITSYLESKYGVH
jgi:Concanavalin A-like lectin/glucanases superfamily